MPRLRSVRILRRPAVLARAGISASTLERLVRRGEFPRPLKISTRCVGWPSAVVDAWLRARVEAGGR